MSPWLTSLSCWKTNSWSWRTHAGDPCGAIAGFETSFSWDRTIRMINLRRTVSSVRGGCRALNEDAWLILFMAYRKHKIINLLFPDSFITFPWDPGIHDWTFFSFFVQMSNFIDFRALSLVKLQELATMAKNLSIFLYYIYKHVQLVTQRMSLWYILAALANNKNGDAGKKAWGLFSYLVEDNKATTVMVVL